MARRSARLAATWPPTRCGGWAASRDHCRTGRRLQESTIEWRRAQAADALAHPPETLDPVQHAKIRNLGQAIHALGDMKREQKDPGCVPPYLEAMKLFQRIGGRREESMSVYNLGRAYEEVPGIRDLDEAERWYSRDRALMADDDIRGHIGLQIQLGNLASRRLEESRNAGGPPGQQTRHANAAIAAYRQALTLIPADDIEARGTTYNQLGLVYRSVGQLDLSFEYLQKAVQCLVDSSNRYGAGAARCNAAKSLLLSGRFAEALLFYRAGLRFRKHWRRRERGNGRDAATGQDARRDARPDERKRAVTDSDWLNRLPGHQETAGRRGRRQAAGDRRRRHRRRALRRQRGRRGELRAADPAPRRAQTELPGYRACHRLSRPCERPGV